MEEQRVASLGGRPLGGTAPVNHVAAALRDLRETQPAPLWVGAHGTRMLGVIGQLADGWICPLNACVPPSAVPERQAAIDRAASEAGRAASDVRRLCNVLGAIDGDGDQGLFGTSEHWARTLAGWTGELGFDTGPASRSWPIAVLKPPYAPGPFRLSDRTAKFGSVISPR